MQNAMVTNKTKEPIALTVGLVLQPDVPMFVEAWDKLSSNAVIRMWEERGVIQVQEGEIQQLQEESPVATFEELFGNMSAKEMRAYLSKAGVPFEKTASELTLRDKMVQHYTQTNGE